MMFTDFEQLIDNLDADIYQRLKTAVEIGKWPNGMALTAEQRNLSLQAVITYEHKHFPAEQRTGFIQRPAERKNSAACGHGGDDGGGHTPIRWK